LDLAGEWRSTGTAIANLIDLHEAAKYLLGSSHLIEKFAIVTVDIQGLSMP